MARVQTSKAAVKGARKSGNGGAKAATRAGAASSVAEPKPLPKSKMPDLGNYGAALRWLHERTDIERQRHVRYSDDAFKLDRMRNILAKLGNPHEQVKTVHVAGTVGKGSTVAMVASMLRACGYVVGEYTSPHLVDVRERILVNGRMVGKPTFTELLKKVAKAAMKAEEEPTFFEVMTAAALKHFAEEAVDVAVIEVGLGGRLDSTNVITPEVSVITTCLLYTSPSPRDLSTSRMPSSA